MQKPEGMSDAEYAQIRAEMQSATESVVTPARQPAPPTVKSVRKRPGGQGEPPLSPPAFVCTGCHCTFYQRPSNGWGTVAGVAAVMSLGGIILSAIGGEFLTNPFWIALPVWLVIATMSPRRCWYCGCTTIVSADSPRGKRILADYQQAKDAAP